MKNFKMEALERLFSIWLTFFIVFISTKTLAAPTTTPTTISDNLKTTLLPSQYLNDQQIKPIKKVDKLEDELSSIADDIGKRLNDVIIGNVIINEEGRSIEPKDKKQHKRDQSEQTTNVDNLINEVDSENNATDHEHKNGPNGHNSENNHEQPQNHQHWSAGLWNHTLSKTSAVLAPVQHVFNSIRHRAQNPKGVHHGNGRDDVVSHHSSGHISRPGDHHSIETEEERLKIEDSLGFHVLEFFGTIAGLLWGLFSNIQRIFSSSSSPPSS